MTSIWPEPAQALLTGLNNNRMHRAYLYTGPQISFDRPELSPCLQRIIDPAKRRETLEIIQAGQESLRRLPP